MHVLLSMAADAVLGRVMKRCRLVAGVAFQNAVLSQQRKRNQVVVEPHLGRPRGVVVAVLAFGAELSLVGIVAATMATGAVGGQGILQRTHVAAGAF